MLPATSRLRSTTRTPCSGPSAFGSKWTVSGKVLDLQAADGHPTGPCDAQPAHAVAIAAIGRGQHLLAVDRERHRIPDDLELDHVFAVELERERRARENAGAV